MANNVLYSGTFKRLYKRKLKRQSDFVIKAMNDGLELLMNAENPESLGSKKDGELKELRALKLGYDNRLIYSIARTGGTCTIYLYKVCTHKEVYGRI